MDTAEPENLSLGTEQFSFDPVSVSGEMHYGSGQRPYDALLGHPISLNPKE
jgi:hypothetical protein